MKNFHCNKFDVIVNKKDGRFKEEKCEDKNCEYCKDRPDKITIEDCNKCRYLHNLDCEGVDYDPRSDA